MVSYTNFTTCYTKYLLGHSWVRDLVNNLLIDVTVWADKTFNFTEFTSLKMVYFDQLLGAALCWRLYIPTSSCVLFAMHIISYYDTVYSSTHSFLCRQKNCINKIGIRLLYNLWNRGGSLTQTLIFNEKFWFQKFLQCNTLCSIPFDSLLFGSVVFNFLPLLDLLLLWQNWLFFHA